MENGKIVRIRLEAQDARKNSELVMDMGADRDENDVYPGGAFIKFPIDQIYESTGTPEVLTMVVSFAGQAISAISLNLCSSWLWEKLTKHKVRKIQIDGLEVQLNDKGEFQRILAKKITIEE